jgi:hypothetical protein
MITKSNPEQTCNNRHTFITEPVTVRKPPPKLATSNPHREAGIHKLMRTDLGPQVGEPFMPGRTM